MSAQKGGEGEGVGALQGIVVCAKSSKGQALVHWIKEAVQNPHVFVFGELLDLPSVGALKGAEDATLASWHKLLTIFSSGTYQDYKTSVGDGSVPKVEAKELHKLKQLTIVSMAAKERSLSYNDIMTAIEINDVRQLEDLLIEIITNGLIKAKLDQSRRKVEIQDAVARDVGPDDISRMLATLDQWSSSATSVIARLTEIEGQANQQFQSRKDHREEMAKRTSDMRAKVKKEAIEDTGRMGGGRSDGDDGYDAFDTMVPAGMSSRGRNTRSREGGHLEVKRGFLSGKGGLFG